MRGAGLVSAALLAPKVAWACSVCRDPNEASGQAFFDMTIFMSLLPLATMGIIGGFVWFKVKAAAAAS